MTYDSAATRARILDTATAEFARHGVAGARIDRIAAEAPANKASIYAYFGSKDALFAAVLHGTLSGLAEAVEVDPERVSEYVGELFDHQVAHPELLRLVQQEAFAFAPGDVGELAERTAHYDDKVAGVTRAQEAGAVDTSLDPRNVVLALIGMVSWFTAAPQISRMIVGDLEKKAVLDRHRAALIEYSRRILSPSGGAVSS